MGVSKTIVVVIVVVFAVVVFIVPAVLVFESKRLLQWFCGVLLVVAKCCSETVHLQACSSSRSSNTLQKKASLARNKIFYQENKSLF